MAFSLTGGLNGEKKADGLALRDVAKDMAAPASAGPNGTLMPTLSYGNGTPTRTQNTNSVTVMPFGSPPLTTNNSTNNPGPTSTPSSQVTVAGTNIGATLGEVTPDMLVESRMANLLKSGNPYMDQAVARARQSANARGMANSTLAGQAGEEAAISAALPIAQQDAGTYFQQQRDNLGYTNQFALADKSMLGQADLQGRDLANRLQISREGNDAQIASANISAGASTANAQLAYQSDMARIASAERLATMDLSSRSHEAELARVWQSTENQLSRDAQTALAQMQLTANERMAIAQLQNTSLVNFGNQVSQIFSSQMSAEDKQRYFNNLLGIYTGSPNFPYRPTAGAYTTPAPAPAPAPAPTPGSEGA